MERHVRDGAPRLPNPTLCLVTDLGVVGGDVGRLTERVFIAVENGVNMVQIRAPDLGDDEFGRLVEEVVQMVAGLALTIVNPSSRCLLPHPDIDGVQLPENARASIDEVRRVYGVSALVGRSVHSSDSARQAYTAGADFVVFGTVFPSATHPGGNVQGVDNLKRAAKEPGMPVIGIGGISVENAGDVMAAGALGIAVVRSILGASEPAAATRDLLDAMMVASADQD